MSYSTLYMLPENGHMLEDSIEFADYKNSWGLGMFMWMALWEKYLKAEHGPFNLMNIQPLWDLQSDPRVSKSDWMVLFSSFDGCIIRGQALELLAKCYDAFTEDHKEFLEGKVWHGPQIAKDLRTVRANHPEMDVFLMVTSITGIAGHENPFYFPPDKVES